MTAQFDADLVTLFKRMLAPVVDELVREKMAELAPPPAAPEDEPRTPKRINVSMKEAAEILGVHTGTIYNMHRAGELALMKIRGRTFVPIAEIERIRATSKQHTSATPNYATPNPVRGPVRGPKSARPKKRQLFPMVR